MYYAVRRGRQPGVYYSWDECKKQVNRYPFARYKKFPTYEQAQHFIRAADYPYNPSRGQEISATVYTDGCCSHNGRYGAQAGIGVYWGPNHPLNVSERLYGRQTNQRAEIEAASRAVEQARDHNVTRLNVCTDSEYTIKAPLENKVESVLPYISLINQCLSKRVAPYCSRPHRRSADRMSVIYSGMTEWVPRWKKNNWLTLYGEEVVNKEEFENLDNLCKELDVQWTQVQGHSGNPGNEKADRLARQGARK